MSALAEQQRPAAGESEAARLYEAHADQIFGYCLRRSRSRSDAEDAVQTTFLYAFRALQRGVVPECESAWLTTIAKNVCQSQHRTLDRRGSLTDDFDADSVGSVDRIATDDQDLCQALRTALTSIPASQQRAIVLSEWHGLSSSEVAAQLGMSTPATYALLTRARRSMAHALTTIPRQAALGLASLVYELRRTIKGLLGGAGAAAKTVAATALVATVAVGGVSAARAVDRDRGTPRVPKPGVVEAGAAEAQRGGVSSAPLRNSAATTAGSRASGESSGVAGELPTTASAPAEGVVPSQESGEIVGTTGSDLVPLPGLLPELPPLPGLLPELPPLLLPPLPTDLLPPAPELPPAPSVPVSESLPLVDPPAMLPLPDSGLPDPLP